MKKLLPSLIFLVTIYSCKQTISKADKELILHEIDGYNNFMEILSIKPVEEIKGNLFDLRKFDMHVKFTKNCELELAKNFAFPKIQMGQSSSLNDNADFLRVNKLKYTKFVKGDTVTIKGGVFLNHSGEEKYLKEGERCLFYLKDNLEDKNLNKDICSEVRIYEEVYLEFIKNFDANDFNLLTQKGKLLGDKLALRFLGSFLKKIQTDRNLLNDTITADEYEELLLIKSLVLYRVIEFQNLECN